MSKSSFCPHLSQHLVLSVFQTVTILVDAFHCYFKLHFPDYAWCGTSFHMLFCHLNIFFSEVSVIRLYFSPFLAYHLNSLMFYLSLWCLKFLTYFPSNYRTSFNVSFKADPQAVHSSSSSASESVFISILRGNITENREFYVDSSVLTISISHLSILAWFLRNQV